MNDKELILKICGKNAEILILQERCKKLQKALFAWIEWEKSRAAENGNCVEKDVTQLIKQAEDALSYG